MSPASTSSGDIMVDAAEEYGRVQYQHQYEHQLNEDDQDRGQQRCDWNYVMDEIR